MQTSSTCAWTATAETPWIAIREGATGTGTGSVRLEVSTNTGPGRTGVVTAAGHAFTVRQAGACRFDISPGSASVQAAGATVDVRVSAPDGCSWSASSATGWLRIAGVASGTGSGTVQVGVQANENQGTRTGAVTIAGHPFTVTQAAPVDACRATIDPDRVDADSRGGPHQLRVTTGASCAWTAESPVSWIRFTAGARGTGDGPVLMMIDRNTGAARKAVVTIAGTPVPVDQARAD